MIGYKTYQVLDRSKQDYKTVKIFTTKHVSDRFYQRALPDIKEDDVKSIIYKAVDKVVNDYPHEPCDYLIKSQSMGIKIPLEVDIENGEFRFNIPTILSYYMRTREENVPNLTFEELKYLLHTEILVD